MRCHLLFLVLAIVATVTLAIQEPPTTLQIDITHPVPESECDRKSVVGDLLSMHYTGTLFSTGEKFDSSLDRNRPFVFKLGSGRVIKGWDQGLVDMCIGEKRRLVIPPHLGYGSRALGAIPSESTLVFDVQLMDIKNPRSKSSSSAAVDTDTNAWKEYAQSPLVLLGVVGVIWVVFKLTRPTSAPAAATKVN